MIETNQEENMTGRDTRKNQRTEDIERCARTAAIYDGQDGLEGACHYDGGRQGDGEFYARGFAD